MVRGIERVDQMFGLTMAAYNLESKGVSSNLFKTGNPEPRSSRLMVKLGRFVTRNLGKCYECSR